MTSAIEECELQGAAVLIQLTTVYFYIYGTFNDTSIISGYVTLQDSIINAQRSGKNVESSVVAYLETL
jgi:hypothetical protein